MAGPRSRSRRDKRNARGSQAMKAYADPALRAAIALQQQANRSTEDQWDRFTAHRKQVTQLLLQGIHATAAPTLCVLGAGNCNDVDLARLAEVYAHIALVDLDVQALGRARLRVPPEFRPKLQSFAPVDVSGVLSRLPQWRQMNTSEEELLSLPRRHAERAAKQLHGGYDRVLSCGLLTQLQLPIVEALGSAHPLFQAATRTVLLTHLRLLARLTRPGASAWLITEVASNLTLPALDSVSAPAELANLFEQVVRQGHVIGVADPVGLQHIMEDDPVLRELRVSFAPAAHEEAAERAAAVEAPGKRAGGLGATGVARRVSAVSAGKHREGAIVAHSTNEGAAAPWLWEQGPKRRYLTYGLCLERPVDEGR